MSSARTDIDVAKLPPETIGPSAPLWWGNTWMLAIEGTMFAIVIAVYYYLRQAFEYWPPPRTHMPDLLLGGAGLAIAAISTIPMSRVNRLVHGAARVTPTLIGLGFSIALAVVAIVIRFYEFPALDTQWNSNAYGSVTWTLLALHLMHLLTMTCEATLLFVWAAMHGLDEKHKLDISLLAIYWFFVVIVQAVLYVVIYLTPYLS